jgi:DNA-binding NtrC family response regulator
MTDDYRIRFLVVDDEQSIRKLCVTIGNSLGFVSAHVESAEAALSYIDAHSPDLVLADLKMANMDGLEFLEKLKRALPRTEVAMMTGHGSIESAVQAMRLGAYDFITKPFRVEELKLVLQRMAEKVRLVSENEFLRERVSTEMELSGIIGSSAKIQDVLRMVARLKNTRTPVLITGESGTGKELVARAVHAASPRGEKPFVPINCGAIPESLLESQLFGHVKGAFTSAVQTSPGLFAAANHGTVFLDEIGEMPVHLQVKLLRAIEEKQVWPVGSTKPVRVDIRIIASTNRELAKEVEAARFRGDLFYRLNVIRIALPPLREHREDIPMLVDHFIAEFNRKLARRVRGIDQEALRALMDSPWKGNVRELEHVIERAVILARDAVIAASDLPASVGTPATAPIDFGAAVVPMRDMQRRYAHWAYERLGGRKVMTAETLGLDFKTLSKLLEPSDEG